MVKNGEDWQVLQTKLKKITPNFSNRTLNREG